MCIRDCAFKLYDIYTCMGVKHRLREAGVPAHYVGGNRTAVTAATC